MTETRTEQAMCIMGRSTSEPCGRPATEPIPRHDDAIELCAFHAALEPLCQEAEDLSLGLALFKEWRKEARKHGGNPPLLKLLDRGRAEFSERLKLIDRSVGDLESAVRAPE